MKTVYGIDITSHRSKLLRKEDVEKAFFIIPVEDYLGRTIERKFSDLIRGTSTKIRYLKQNIPDPWGDSVEIFGQRAAMIEHLLDDIVQSLRSE